MIEFESGSLHGSSRLDTRRERTDVVVGELRVVGRVGTARSVGVPGFVQTVTRVLPHGLVELIPHRIRTARNRIDHRLVDKAGQYVMELPPLDTIVARDGHRRGSI